MYILLCKNKYIECKCKNICKNVYVKYNINLICSLILYIRNFINTNNY